uniref:Uncharacterized protein n=1 Tax=Anguilla anguilla TaxID=7936 RepID=A0A0E9V6P5_ANGAN
MFREFLTNLISFPTLPQRSAILSR